MNLFLHVLAGVGFTQGTPPGQLIPGFAKGSVHHGKGSMERFIGSESISFPGCQILTFPGAATEVASLLLTVGSVWRVRNREFRPGIQLLAAEGSLGRAEHF